MKATGIVRRIDDLGRIVIPKEIRSTMHIRESDPLEIYTGNSGEIIFKKYSALGEIPTFAEKFAEILQKEILCPVIITDRDSVIAVSGASKSEFLGKKISQEAEIIIEKRTQFVQSDNSKTVSPIEGVENYAKIISPILTNGDISGSVIVLNSESKISGSICAKITQLTAKFISAIIEN
ncbi:MAG: stage V sporulation T C-terminal domain-containing protein [Clostridia bacterium]|nr:stage V sporulation T C-terminal domain-containing protein [Clostridia bacterium]